MSQHSRQPGVGATPATPAQVGAPPGVSDIASYEGPADELARRILSLQGSIAGAVAGALLAPVETRRFDLIAHWAADPNATPPGPWLERSAPVVNAAMERSAPVVAALDAEHSAACVPAPGLSSLGVPRTAVVFLLPTADPIDADAARERLALAAPMISLIDLRLALSATGEREAMLRHAAESVLAVNAHARAEGAAMALVNELAARLGASRVALGLVRAGGCELVSVSHTERFVRAADAARAVEEAIDEALDQDTDTHTAAFDTEAEPPSFVRRQLEDLARAQGAAAACVLPLRSHAPSAQGRGTTAQSTPIGAVAIEWTEPRPIPQWVRLALDLAAPRLIELDEHDAWLGRRIALRARRALRSAASPVGLTWKLGTLAAALALLSTFFIPADLTAGGSFTARPSERRVVAAPFDGYLSTVAATVGDRVRADQSALATLDTTDLRLRLSEARAERDGLLRQAEAARAAAAPGTGSSAVGAMADARLLESQADEAAARVGLYESMLARAALTAPIDGVIVSGELERLRGAAVRAGDPLFEIVSDSGLYAEVTVPESRAADVALGHAATLTPTGRPDQRLTGKVLSVAPSAEVLSQRNIVRVRVAFDEPPPPWLKPGMEGVASITTGSASVAHAWTRGATDWLRLRLWW